jgi:hypothetical protein
MRHYFDFGPARELVGGDLVRPEAWDALRTQSDGPFAIAHTREALERSADERQEIVARVREIHRWLEEHEVRVLASYGVGGGIVEVLLERVRPDRRLVLTEYAPATVARLRELFPGADVRRHDLLADPPAEADAHLFHRIDTELGDEQWREVFRRFKDETVVVVATEVAGSLRLARELWLRLRNRNVARAGWLRNRAAFEWLWAETHDAEPFVVHDLQAWALTPRRS